MGLITNIHMCVCPKIGYPKIHWLAFSFQTKIAIWWYTTFSNQPIYIHKYIVYIYIHIYIYIIIHNYGILFFTGNSPALLYGPTISAVTKKAVSPAVSAVSHLAPHEVSLKPQPSWRAW